MACRFHGSNLLIVYAMKYHETHHHYRGMELLRTETTTGIITSEGIASGRLLRRLLLGIYHPFWGFTIPYSVWHVYGWLDPDLLVSYATKSSAANTVQVVRDPNA